MTSYFLFKSRYGALTAKPYAFISRSWELTIHKSFDFTDSSLTTVNFFYRGLEIVRVLPSSSSDFEWIADRVRFFHEGFKLQRLKAPLLKLFLSNFFLKVSWPTAFSYFSIFSFTKFLPISFFEIFGYRNSLSGSSVGFDFINGFNDFENFSFSKSFFLRAGIKRFYSSLGLNQTNLYNLNDWRSAYFSSVSFQYLLYAEEERNLNFFFIFFNPRLENPILNTRIRFLVTRKNSNVLVFGSSTNSLSYTTYDLGSNLDHFYYFLQGRHKFCRYVSGLSDRSCFLVLYGFHNILNLQIDFRFFYSLINNLMKIGSFINLHIFPISRNSSALVENEVNIPVPIKHYSNSSVLYIFENNEVEVDLKAFNLVVYQGFQAEFSLKFADLVFPSYAYFENSFSVWKSDGTFLKTSDFRHELGSKLRSSLSIFENLDLFLFYKESESLSVAEFFKNRFVVRFIFKSIYWFFLNQYLNEYNLNSGVFNNFFRFLASLGFSVLLEIDLNMDCSETYYGGNLDNYPNVFREFSILAQFFVFRNLFFLVFIQRRQFNVYNPRLFIYLDGRLPDPLNFCFSFMRLSGFFLRMFLKSFCFYRLNTMTETNFIRARRLVKRVYVSSFLSPLKKGFMRGIFNLAFILYKRYSLTGLVSLQSHLYCFDDSTNFQSFCLFHSLKKVGNLISNKALYNFSFLKYYPIFDVFLDKHISSSIRFSKALFLKELYFSSENYNFQKFIKNF